MTRKMFIIKVSKLKVCNINCRKNWPLWPSDHLKVHSVSAGTPPSACIFVVFCCVRDVTGCWLLVPPQLCSNSGRSWLCESVATRLHRCVCLFFSALLFKTCTSAAFRHNLQGCSEVWADWLLCSDYHHFLSSFTLQLTRPLLLFLSI